MRAVGPQREEKEKQKIEHGMSEFSVFNKHAPCQLGYPLLIRVVAGRWRAKEAKVHAHGATRFKRRHWVKMPAKLQQKGNQP
jgi:phosphopantetheinyl transferase (holo-ACP synthase)